MGMKNSLPEHTSFNYDKIINNLYIGTNQCCIVHFKTSLTKKGIQADICLEKEHLDNPTGAKYFLWLPIKDKSAPTQKQLLIGANAIKSFIDNNIKTYVHCKNGHGRSPTLVAAYLILEKKITAEKALEEIRKKRKIHPTKNQIKALKEFEKNLRSKPPFQH